jgi:hypothetical protein
MGRLKMSRTLGDITFPQERSSEVTLRLGIAWVEFKNLPPIGYGRINLALGS